MSVQILIGYLAIAAAGLWVLRLRFVRQRPPIARWGVAVAVGTVTLTIELLLLSAAGVSWTTSLLIGTVVVALLLVPMQAVRGPIRWALHPPVIIGALLVTLAMLLLGFGLLTGRATSTDYLYFWGTKGFRFARTGALDVPFLARPDYYLLHADYPPLVPVIYAAVSLIGRSRSWWLGPVGTLFYAMAAVLGLWGLCREGLGARMGACMAGLLAAVLGIGLVAPYSGGNAEAILTFFGVVALTLLTMFEREPAAEWLASISLLGLVLAKIEGGVLAMVIVIAFGALARDCRVRRSIRLAVFPTVGICAWLLFARAHLILNWYRQPYGAFTLQFFHVALGAFARAASYDAYYLPWIVPLAIVVVSPHRRAALRSIAVGVAYAGFAFFCFLHGKDSPVGWITAVAPRLLLTSVVCFVVSAAKTCAAPRGHSVEHAA